MRATEILTESLHDWDTGRWIHYSNVPYLKINYNPGHLDPLGIYLFPERFTPEGQWRTYGYRFTVEVKPNARILDFATTSQERFEALLDATGFRQETEYDRIMARYPVEKPGDVGNRIWDALKEGFGYGRRAKLRFNTFLRQQGIDAVFDDTGGIFVNEVQMAVMNPRAIRIVGMDRQGGSGYAEVEKVMGDLRDMAKRLGVVVTDVSTPRRRTGRYRRDQWHIEAEIVLRNPVDPEENYARLRVYSDDVGKGERPKEVGVSLSYSKPYLNYGVGVRYSISKQKYDSMDGLGWLEKDIRKIFEPVAAEG